MTRTTRTTTPPDTVSHLKVTKPEQALDSVSFTAPGYRIDVERRGLLRWTGQLMIGARGIRLANVGRSGSEQVTDAFAMAGWTPVGPERTFRTRRRAHARMTDDLALIQRAHHELTHSVITIHTTDPKDAS